MDQKEIIRDLLFQYETAGLIEHDADKVLSLLAEDIIGVGMGEQGLVASKEDVMRIMRETARHDPSAQYTLDIQDVVIHLTSEHSAQVCARVNVKSIRQGHTAVSAFMQSLSFVRGGDDWRICALHASPVMLTEESVRNYPMAFADNTLKQLQLETNRQNETIVSSMHYAGRIQKNLLPPSKDFRQAFSDYAIIWDPKDIVGGDLYWLRNFKHGAMLCVCDCTGHGIPGALLTMLAASALDTAVDGESSRDPARVLQELDRRLANILNAEQNILDGYESKMTRILDGCDIAVLYLSRDGSVSIASANIPVYVCNGREVRRLRGQRLHVGEGAIRSRDDIQVVTIPPDPENRFFIATDGLFDQIGVNNRPFGYRVFSDLILKHHGEPLEVTAQRIYNRFQEHMGGQPRRDDIEMIAFKP